MENKYPVPGDELMLFYRKIAHVVESKTGHEAQRLVRDWSPQLYTDMRSEAEVLMLMHGQGVSDKYLFGLCSAVASIKAENGGHLPTLTPEQYELDKEVQTSHILAEDDAAHAYFGRLEQIYLERFPLTATLMNEMARNLKWRLAVPDLELNEGFSPGWQRGARVALPLFVE